MLPDMALPQPTHAHVLTPAIPKAGTFNLHLPKSIESHLPEKLTHQKERRASVQAFEAELENDITSHEHKGKPASDEEVARLTTELHHFEGMTEREKEKWVAFRETGQPDGGRRRSLATGYEGGVVIM